MDFQTFLGHLLSQRPDGPTGFEGLVSKLLEHITDSLFYIAASGRQEGRDMANVPRAGTYILAECKRYDDNTRLGSDELLVKLQRALNYRQSPDIFLVVTTKRLSEQHERDLRKIGDKDGVTCHLLDAEGDEESDLAALCAAGPAIVADHLKNNEPHLPTDDAADLQTYLEGLTTRDTVQSRITRLKEDLIHDAAGYALWCTRQNAWLASKLASMRESQAAFSQDLAVRDSTHHTVTRPHALEAFDKWWEGWPAQKNGIAVLGEEGDGKSWAVCAWIAEQLEGAFFPPVLFIPSTRLESRDAMGCLTQAVQQQLGLLSKELWTKRFNRWLEATPMDAPFLLVVLDGLNERPSFEHALLLAELNAQPFAGRVAVLATCRTLFWNDHLKDKIAAFETWVLPPYDDDELAEALSSHDLRRDNIGPQLLTVIRKPRYFDLVIKLRDQLEDIGEVTIARLLYEDRRDRLSRKLHDSGNRLTHEDFQELIAGVTNRWRESGRELSRNVLFEQTKSFGDRHLLDELRSECILVRDGSRWSVDEHQLTLGLGLLLANAVLDASTEDATELDELTASWLEPHPDMDLKVAVCGMAFFHSMQRADFPYAGRLALFRAWLRGRNIGSNGWRELTAYFPTNPNVYISMAEHVWTLEHNHAEAQDAFMRGFLKYRDISAVHQEFVRTFPRWLGFVHPDGHAGRSAARHINRPQPDFQVVNPTDYNEQLEKSRQEIATLLGTASPEGVIERYGYALEITQEEGWLRLGAVALAVISHMDRAPFAPGLVAYALAGTAMGHPTHHEAYLWTLRTSPDDIEPLMLEAAKALIAEGAPLALRAVWTLLVLLGTSESFTLARKIPFEHQRKNFWSEIQESNPCHTLGHGWTEQQFYECFETTFGSPNALADALKQIALIPAVEVPETLSQRLEGACENLDISKVATSVHRSSQDHEVDTVDPALCAFNPSVLAEVWRRLAHELLQRDRDKRWRLAMDLYEHVLIMGNSELAALEQAWRDVNALPGEDEKRAELVLFSMAVWNKSTDDFIELLSERHESAYNSLNYPGLFALQVQDTFAIENKLGEWIENQHHALMYLLAQIVQQETPILTSSMRELLLNKFNELDTGCRGLSLHLFALKGDITAANAIFEMGWRHSETEEEYERYWGSRLLAEYATDASFEELLDRVWPPLLGVAVARRGGRAEDVALYAKRLDAIVSNVLTKRLEPMEKPELLSIKSNQVDGGDSLRSWSMQDQVRPVYYRSWDGWGGVAKDPDDDPFSRAQDINAREQEIRERRERCWKRIEAEEAAGNPFFLQQIDPAALADVARAHPKFVQRWIAPVQGDSSEAASMLAIHRTFYEALCTALLETDPSLGAELFVTLCRTPGCRVQDNLTDIDNLLFILFNAPPSEPVDELCREVLLVSFSDGYLFDAAFVAQWTGRKDILESMLAQWLASPRAYDQALVVMLLGFLDDRSAATRLEEFVETHKDCWQSHVACEIALRNHDRNQWARHWFHRFLTTQEDLDAWAAFRLFLRCADRRFWLWRNELVQSCSTTESRRIHLHASLHRISQKILKNERETMKLEERFLGYKILGGEVSPWMG